MIGKGQRFSIIGLLKILQMPLSQTTYRNHRVTDVNRGPTTMMNSWQGRYETRPSRRVTLGLPITQKAGLLSLLSGSRTGERFWRLLLPQLWSVPPAAPTYAPTERTTRRQVMRRFRESTRRQGRRERLNFSCESYFLFLRCFGSRFSSPDRCGRVVCLRLRGQHGSGEHRRWEWGRWQWRSRCELRRQGDGRFATCERRECAIVRGGKQRLWIGGNGSA